ncbi:hypothetical protein HY486_00890 [Candidatus Woesearchaeota archaeon]|nr:hypothetical protein [Candidatus Woesearchaeota archaeon]
MSRKGAVESRFVIRVTGAIIGAIGFFLLAYQRTIIGTALVGIGSLLIAVGEP